MLDAVSGEALSLSVTPAALQGASSVIGGHAAPLAVPTESAPASTETAGLAGAALHQALDAYCAAFAQRLSTMATGLTSAAAAYTCEEASSVRSLADLAPTEEL
jgi:hypothetical protein